jgi:RimJ/RimL family protein N-acetyltransferase
MDGDPPPLRDQSQKPPTLADGVVLLRAWRHDDAPAIFAACQDAEIARWVPIPWPYHEPDALTLIDASAAGWRDGTAAHFAVIDAATGSMVGAITRYGPDSDRGIHRATFGYWVAAAARGRGVATRALTLIVDWTLATTDVIRLDLETFAGNEASAVVAARCGFTPEGILRARYVHRGVPMDAVSFSRIRLRSS